MLRVVKVSKVERTVEYSEYQGGERTVVTVMGEMRVMRLLSS